MTFLLILPIPLLAKAPMKTAYKENPSSHKTTEQHLKGKHTAKNINEINALKA